MLNCLRAFTVVAAFVPAAGAMDWRLYQRQGCVSDFVSVVDPASRAQLETYCAAVERSTGVRLSLVAIPTLYGEPADLVAAAFYRGWYSTAPVDGVVLLVALADRRTSLYAGARLRPLLPAGLSTSVLREMGPALRQPHYGEAFMAAAETIGGALARAKNARVEARLARRLHWQVSDAVPWLAIGGAVALVIALCFAGAPGGFSGSAGRGLIPALMGRRAVRGSWGSRGSGGFGACDSADSFGGFGGGEAGPRRGGGDW